MNVTVLKLGGSLSTSPRLQQWLVEITQFAKQQNIIVVPGGGSYADHVRSQQLQQEFDDLTAHRLAILAMSQTGYWLMGKCHALLPVNDSGKVLPQLDQGLPLLWLPLELLDDTGSIPASWDYTSDSIALWLAGKLQSDQLLLVKRRILSADSDLTDYINKDIVDKGFQLLRKNIKSKVYIFGEDNYPALTHHQAWPSMLMCEPRQNESVSS